MSFISFFAGKGAKAVTVSMAQGIGIDENASRWLGIGAQVFVGTIVGLALADVGGGAATTVDAIKDAVRDTAGDAAMDSLGDAAVSSASDAAASSFHTPHFEGYGELDASADIQFQPDLSAKSLSETLRGALEFAQDKNLSPDIINKLQAALDSGDLQQGQEALQKLHNDSPLNRVAGWAKPTFGGGRT